MDTLKSYYENTAERFWDPLRPLTGRDQVVFPLINEFSGTLLEYGCGSGSLLLAAAQADNFSKVVGADISDKALSRVRQAWDEHFPGRADRVQLLQPEHDRLPGFDNASFDAIVSVSTIEHVLDPYIVLDELYRLAKPGATLVCSVPNYAYLKHRISLLLGRLPRTGTDEPVENWRTAGWDGMHLHTFTQSAFGILLRDCGWEAVKWTGWGDRLGFLRPLRSRYPGLLSGELVSVCRRRA
jgi:SAM-dependent methyltransferase